MKLEKILSIRKVYYHASCPDGTASAIICAKAFKLIGHEADFQSLQHDSDEMKALLPEEGQLFIDITPPKDRWECWRSVNPIVLDHHETVQHVTEGLGGVYATNEKHSGAMLAYEQVYLPCFSQCLHRGIDGYSEEADEMEEFAKLCMIRDTWKNRNPLWKDAHALALALKFHGSRNLLKKVTEKTFSLKELLELGQMLLEQHERKVELTAEKSFFAEHEVNGQSYKFALFNTTEAISSDVGNALLAQGVDVAVGYFYTLGDGAIQTVVSLRTNERVSACRVCEINGGGGHARAAGFRLKEGFHLSPSDILGEILTSLVQTNERT